MAFLGNVVARLVSVPVADVLGNFSFLTTTPAMTGEVVAHFSLGEESSSLEPLYSTQADKD
jgi:hypothetical protein